MVRIAALAALLALASGPARAQETVRLGNLKFAHYGAVSYMKEHCKKFGLNVEEIVFPKGIDIFPAIVKGEVDLAASAADAAIANRSGGGQVYVVAGFAKGGARLVSAVDQAITKVADLKGKKVGVARGGAQELLLLAELSKAGLTWSDKPGKDVQIVYMAFADLNQALMQKQIDAMCQSEPQSSQAINKGFGKEVLKPYDTPLGEPVRVMVMTEKLYKERPQVAQKVLDCFVDATKYFIDNPKAAEKYVVEQMFKGQITPEDYRDAISNSPFSYDVTAEHIQITTDLMAKYGVGKMQKPPKATDWVKTDLLQHAKQKAGVK
ncbi:ABC nitrate/sulfonate/bicarbonate transporter, periplasmic ligand binding protein [Anaeromyxobacter dehalogenans 2CP-1]|uniref:ABC nitrate/sulfonate/bicarbonate transporter, periplasmic ligand binding protein n=1 Tax=Anaeromyxobacter dehalogenans (strain ATCC BAA-258 / DSM 21875 / 2CP-1) TaxID=455488 RepID=B8J7N3_ANAD2|nr:ABC transporter substrate-binding protein [Anaeromyxobacter dehalogenans]ACL67213.1 ABC nitrate/sulfonate/bicarbonate transporter, periplasmic ligand binding protein [Anaeromyxobacter dehalogenans 2CP-1]